MRSILDESATQFQISRSKCRKKTLGTKKETRSELQGI